MSSFIFHNLSWRSHPDDSIIARCPLVVKACVIRQFNSFPRVRSYDPAFCRSQARRNSQSRNPWCRRWAVLVLRISTRRSCYWRIPWKPRSVHILRKEHYPAWVESLRVGKVSTDVSTKFAFIFASFFNRKLNVSPNGRTDGPNRRETLPSRAVRVPPF